MSARPVPRLATGSLPQISESVASATASPARGKEMRANLLSKLRPPPLVHTWDFWFEKPPAHNPPAASFARQQQPPAAAAQAHGQTQPEATTNTSYSTSLTHLHAVSDVRAFWSVLNNFPLSKLAPRTSLHLFHAHVKPLWEDPRNARGGAWTFRVAGGGGGGEGAGADVWTDVWTDVCLLAVGEKLQAAVEADQRDKLNFRDDICGVSIRRRREAWEVKVWNRDAGHAAGIEAVRRAVEGAVKDKLAGEGRYKAHSENEGFVAGPEGRRKEEDGEEDQTRERHEEAQRSIRAVEAEVERVKRILEEVELSDGAMRDKLTAAEAEQSEGAKATRTRTTTTTTDGGPGEES